MTDRLTDKAWKNFDPWECCGQDNFCRRGCHDEGGCTNGCIVPKLYSRLASYEDIGVTPEEFIKLQAVVEAAKTIVKWSIPLYNPHLRQGGAEEDRVIKTDVEALKQAITDYECGGDN